MRHLLAALIGLFLVAPALAQLPPEVAAGQRKVRAVTLMCHEACRSSPSRCAPARRRDR